MRDRPFGILGMLKEKSMDDAMAIFPAYLSALGYLVEQLRGSLQCIAVAICLGAFTIAGLSWQARRASPRVAAHPHNIRPLRPTRQDRMAA